MITVLCERVSFFILRKEFFYILSLSLLKKENLQPGFLENRHDMQHARGRGNGMGHTTNSTTHEDYTGSCRKMSLKIRKNHCGFEGEELPSRIYF